MRNRPLIAVFLVLAGIGVPASAGADPACPAPRCRDVTVPVPDAYEVPNPTVRVVVPSGYAKKRKRYPVVYLLHGVGDTFKTWTEQTDLIRFTAKTPAIFVMPDGGSGPNAGWYSDWKDGSRHWEGFHIDVLLPYIDKHFRTLGRKGRAVAGASMGGFGAMKYAARHRRAFRAAATFSGFVDTMFAAPVSGTFYHHAGQGFGGQSLGTPNENVWGDQTTDEATWRANNPTDLAAKLAGVSLFIACGDGTPGGASGDDPSRPHGYVSESYLHQQNQGFVDALDDAGVKRYRTDFYSGYHHWPYWQQELHRALPKLLAAMSR